MTDYNNMTLREELEARFKEADKNKKEAEFLSRGWQPPTASYQAGGLQQNRDYDGNRFDTNKFIENLNNLNFGYQFGLFAADGAIAWQHLQEMKRANQELIKKYGRGAANGTDDYYHALLQCHLAQMRDEDKRNGIFLGYVKEYPYDYVKKRFQGQSHEQVIKDSTKDLNNNAYGSNIGYTNPDRPCVDLLDHMRTENMRNAGIR